MRREKRELVASRVQHPTWVEFVRFAQETDVFTSISADGTNQLTNATAGLPQGSEMPLLVMASATPFAAPPRNIANI